MTQAATDNLAVGGWVQPLTRTVAQLPTTGVPAGATLYCPNCRVLTDTVGIGGTLSFTQQAAGAGTGSLVTWCASAAAWYLPGTAIVAQA